jgi:hypothetical protein
LGSLWMVPFHWLRFCLLCKIMDPGIICCNILNLPTAQKKWLLSQLYVPLWGSEQPISTHTFEYPRSWMMWLTLSLLIERLSAGCWVVMHWTLEMVVSAFCSISGLTAVTGCPEWGKSGISLCFSCFGSRRCFHPVTNSASVNRSTSINMEDFLAVSDRLFLSSKKLNHSMVFVAHVIDWLHCEALLQS